MLVLVINGSDHPRGSLLSNCLLTLIVALLKKNIKKHKQIKTTNKQTKIIKKTNPNWNKTFQHNRFASHLETFKGISIYFLVNKNQVVLNDLLNCWAVSGNALDFFPLPERLCVLGGRAARLFFLHSARETGCHLPEWCVVLGAARGSSQSSAGGRPSRHGAGCLFSKPLYLRLLVRLMLGEFC